MTSYLHVPAERCTRCAWGDPPSSRYDRKYFVLLPIGGMESGSFHVSELPYASYEEAVAQAKLCLASDEGYDGIVILRSVALIQKR